MRYSHAGRIGVVALRYLCSAEIMPLSVSPSESWDGNDGLWSSFTIRVGTPEQVVRVFPSTAIPESWVVLPAGCPQPSSPWDCNSTRGGLFFPNQSSTWVDVGPFTLAVEENLNYSNWNNGDYGYDQLSLGWVGSGGPILRNQVVAGIATSQWYLGFLGLNPQSINFTTYNDPRPSLLSTLRTTGSIASLSYGYTAGAPYRLKKVLGSLTLGGHDASRFTPNAVKFKFAPDKSRDLVVAIQSIEITTATGPYIALRDQPIYAYIDSTVPHIWLPLRACEAFEAAFKITWDPTTDLYLVNDSLHETLLSENANVTFLLGDVLAGGETISITLPYSSFDLSVSWPIVQNTTRYFPLRRAVNDTQVTLGRTFLQEAYLTVDYERANFSVSQAVFNRSALQQLVTITPPNASHGTTNLVDGKNGTQHLSPGAIAGVVIGAVLLIAIALFLVTRHRRRRDVKQLAKQAAEIEAMQRSKPELDAIGTEIVQLDGKHMIEMDGQVLPVMAGGTPIHEMPGSTPLHEMPGLDVPGERRPR